MLAPFFSPLLRALVGFWFSSGRASMDYAWLASARPYHPSEMSSGCLCSFNCAVALRNGGGFFPNRLKLAIGPLSCTGTCNMLVGHLLPAFTLAFLADLVAN